MESQAAVEAQKGQAPPPTYGMAMQAPQAPTGNDTPRISIAVDSREDRKSIPNAIVLQISDMADLTVDNIVDSIELWGKQMLEQKIELNKEALIENNQSMLNDDNFEVSKLTMGAVNLEKKPLEVVDWAWPQDCPMTLAQCLGQNQWEFQIAGNMIMHYVSDDQYQLINQMQVPLQQQPVQVECCNIL